MGDLATAYGQAQRGERIDLGAKTTSFQQWARELTEYTESGGLDTEIEYWNALPAAPRPPVDLDGPNSAHAREIVKVELDEAGTKALLHTVPGKHRAQINDVLLAALGRTLAEFSGHDQILVNLEGHGREEVVDGVDVSRTVGWFTTQFPVDIPVDGQSWRARIAAVKRRLRQVPQRGIGYGLLRYVKDELQGGTGPYVSFNYLGQVGTGSAADGFYGDEVPYERSAQAPTETGPHLLDFVAMVVGGRLVVQVMYSSDTYHAGTIVGLADGFVAALTEIISGGKTE
jgi:non-ribosomal peptide synthase protein (TIGR01720 family)